MKAALFLMGCICLDALLGMEIANGPYRYILTRDLNNMNGNRMMVIGCNPSVANANDDDNTIKRVKGIATNLGYNGFIMANLFAYRETQPEVMQNNVVQGNQNSFSEAIGQNIVVNGINGQQVTLGNWNDYYIKEAARDPSVTSVVFAYGDIAVNNKWNQFQSEALKRVEAVKAAIRETGKPMYAFKITQCGNPQHPLHVPIGPLVQLY